MPGGDRGAEGYISKYFLKTPKIDNLPPPVAIDPITETGGSPAIINI